ncbi:MAG: DUF4349 domain-containing protein [Candidatus Margulisiibacteriota bacterium]
MKKHLVYFSVLIFVLSLGLAGCTDKSDKFSDGKNKARSVVYKEEATGRASATVAPNQPGMPAPKQVMAGADMDEPVPAVAEKKVQRKIIYSSNLKLKVKDVSKTIEEIKALTKKNKGYIGSSSIEKDANETKSGQIIVRVPPEKLEDAIALIKKMGDVVEDSMTGEDITKDYYDLQARAVNSQKFETRLLLLLETKTTKVKDMLEVEKELARVRSEIESFQGQIRYYNNLVGMATITVDLYEEGVNLPARGNILQPIIDTFSAAFGSFFASVGEILILIFGAAPWVIFGILVIYVLVRIWKRLRGKPKE